jgi:hypothetical protein
MIRTPSSWPPALKISKKRESSLAVVTMLADSITDVSTRGSCASSTTFSTGMLSTRLTAIVNGGNRRAPVT